MKSPIRYLAPALAAVALGRSARMRRQRARRSSAAAATAIRNTGANPFVFVPPGDELPG